MAHVCCSQPGSCQSRSHSSTKLQKFVVYYTVMHTALFYVLYCIEYTINFNPAANIICTLLYTM